MVKPTVLLASPLTGAVSGLEAVTRALLDSPLQERWDLRHVDTATAVDNTGRGVLSVHGIRRFAKILGQLRQAIRQHPPKVAIVQAAANRGGFIKFAIISAVCWQKGIPVVARFGGGNFDKFYDWLSPQSRRLVREVMNRCALTLVEANCLKRQFAAIVPLHKMFFAYLGIDPKPFICKPRKRKAQNLLYVGHVTKAKGAMDLLAAMPKVARCIPGVRLTMLGEHLSRERNVLHVEDPRRGWRMVTTDHPAVHAPGLMVGPGKYAAFREADIFIFPSLSEGFPIAILEAMASALPIICTSVGALPEVLLGGTHCEWVPDSNPEALSEAIIAMAATSDQYRNLMGRANRFCVEKRFTLEQLADNVGDVIDTII